LTIALRYLLDTNILSDLVQHPQGPVASHITRVGEETVCTNIIVAAELRFGAVKSGSSKLADRVDLILSAIETLPLEIAENMENYANILHAKAHRLAQMICLSLPMH